MTPDEQTGCFSNSVLVTFVREGPYWDDADGSAGARVPVPDWPPADGGAVALPIPPAAE